MSKRVGMIYKLMPQEVEEIYAFDKISSDDIHGLSVSMLEAFKDTVDFNGETLEELNKELIYLTQNFNFMRNISYILYIRRENFG
jgi:hypothetical protein